MNKAFENIIYDLDGTLVDTKEGIELSLKHAVSITDPNLDFPDLNEFIGPPLQIMLSHIWPSMNEIKKTQILQIFRIDYYERGCFFSKSYPMVETILKKFSDAGKRQFVLTNKPAMATIKILNHLNIARYFEKVMSPDSGEPSSGSKSARAARLINSSGLRPNSTLLVGDSYEDFCAAQDTGVSFLGASYGYGDFDKNVTKKRILRLNTFSDLVKITG